MSMRKNESVRQWKKWSEFSCLNPRHELVNAFGPLTTVFKNQAAPGCPSPDLCPLNRARVGSCVRVRKLNAPPEISQRLREIGFGEDQQVRLVSSQNSVICMVCNARLALSPELAATILVEAVPPSTHFVA